MTPSGPARPPAGVLLVDKPPGPTSHDVVDRLRRTLGERRVGHTGTLDPFASGLLVLCVGSATRIAEYITRLDKEYLATVRFGVRTATDDPEGAVEAVSEAWRTLDPATIERALAAFRGAIRQVPPRFSAKKVEGEAAHRRARRGEEVRLAETEVTVHELELVGVDLPLATLRVRCSSGTYVRALARDLGERLGTGAHLAALRRTRVGRLTVEDAIPWERVGDRAAVERSWLEPEEALAHMPSFSLGAEDAARLAHGQTVEAPPADLPEGAPALALREGELVAIVAREGGRLRPRKVFRGEPAR